MIEVVILQLLNLVPFFLRTNRTNFLSHISEVVANCRIGKRSQKDPLVVVHSVGAEVQTKTTLGTRDGHSDEKYFLLLESCLTKVYVHQYPVSCQNLSYFDTKLVDFGAHEVTCEVEVLQ